ncbi:DUF6232 family protein [Streptomyces sp. NPDC015220]|uniref:DUF6232 family protein n=1 Tax=Streptomyces sp. NPDC015220 TaxID=3364947 RepID=UPI0036F9FF7A
MDSVGDYGAPPPGPPPRPPLAPPASRKGGTLVLQVSRRMLWVGSVAIPLHSITWVDAFRLKPDRGAAVNRFLKWLIGLGLVLAVISSTTKGEVRVSGQSDVSLSVLLIVLVVYALKDLFEPAKPVLVVEMASGSTVVVTLPSVDELRQIADRIVRAIDNPEAEFSTLVQQFRSNTTNNYGSVVNMHGGRGNTGFKL